MPLSAADRGLAERLVAARLVDPRRLQALSGALPPGASLGEALVAQGWLAPAQVQQLLGLPLGAARCARCGAGTCARAATPCPHCGGVLHPWLRTEPPNAGTLDGTRTHAAPSSAGSTRGGQPAASETLDGLHTQAGRPEAPSPKEAQRSGSASERCGRYLLEAELGRGAFGAVFRAWDPQHERAVALKLLDRQGDAARQRFAREVKALAQLSHPNLVPLLDSGEHDGRPFLVMELVPGRPLAALADGPRRLPVSEAARLLRDVARGVQHAHEHGVLHRDLKPDNVLVSDEGVPRVVDFGLARLRGQRGRLTQSLALMGTPAYMPPEQAGAGQRADERSDVYSLGSTLYHLLCGRPPFEGTSAHQLVMALHEEEPVRPSARNRRVPVDLDTICLRCLEKEPARRYPSAAALAEDLHRFLRDEPIAARPPGAGERLFKWVRRNRTLAFLGSVAAALLVWGTVAALLYVSRERDAARRAEREAIVAGARSAAQEQAVPADALLAGLEGLPAGQRAAELEHRTARGLDALLAAQRWETLAPADSAAQAARRSAANALGRLTQLGEQWQLAGWALAEAGAGEDDPAVTQALEALEEARHARARARRERLEALLGRAERGELAATRDGLEDALFAIVRQPETQTVELLAERLDTLSQDVHGAALAALRETALPDAEERKLDEDSIEGLEDALTAWKAGTDPAQWSSSPAPVKAARRRLEARELRRLNRDTFRGIDAGAARTAGQLLAQHQGAALGTRVDLARLACEGLGWLGLPEPGAVAALGRYLLAEEDSRRASWAALALCRLGGDEARRHVLSARRRFAASPDFTRQIDRLLPNLAEDAPAPPGDALDRDALALARAGRDRLLQGDHRGAIELLTRVLEQNPDDVAARHDRAQARSLMGDVAGFRQDFAHLLRLRPDDADIHTNLGIALASLRLPREAIAPLTRALELDPQSARAYAARGESYRRLGELPRALADLDRALELRPSDAAAWQFRARAHLALGHAQQAEQDARASLRLDPDEAETSETLAQALLVQGRPQEALAASERALQADPRFAPALVTRAQARGDLGDREGALADVQRALALKPDDPAVWSELGRVHAALGQLDQALTALSRGLEGNPRSGHLLVGRAEILMRMARFQEALVDLERVIALEPQVASHRIRRSQALRETGSFQEALEDAEVALRLAPRSANAWAFRGMARSCLGELEAALADLDQALQLAPRRVDLLCARARLRRQHQDEAGAVEDCTQALELAPAREAYETRALAREALGEFEDAVDDLSAALELEPRRASVWLIRARLNLLLYRGAETVRDADRARELGSRDPTIFCVRGMARTLLHERKAAIADLERFLELRPQEAVVRGMLERYRAASPDTRMSLVPGRAREPRR